MELHFNKANSNWNNSISAKEIIEMQFSPGYTLLNSKHPVIDQINELLFCKYKCVIRFKKRGYNDEKIWVNKPLVFRKSKFGSMIFSEGVKLIEGTPTSSGGSNNYPAIGFKEGYCVLEFVSDFFPCVPSTSGWVIDEIITLEKLNP